MKLLQNNIGINYFAVFVIVLLTNTNVLSQNAVMPDCLGNPPAGNTCETATPICDLNGYCGTTSLGVYTANYWGEQGLPIGCGTLWLEPCPGIPGIGQEFCGSIENNSFLTIVADATTISFNVWVFNSTYDDGIQLAVYEIPTCGTGGVNQLYCNGQMLPTGTTNYHNVVVNGLTPGNTYYIMIDGFAGDECDYVIGAESGIAIPVTIDPVAATICAGESITLTADGGDGTYTWDNSSDLNVLDAAEVIASPPGPGTYTYTVNSNTGNPSCPSNTSAETIITVEPCLCTVNAQNSGPVCVGDVVDLLATDVNDASYEWSGPDGFSANVQNGIGVNVPTTPGDYIYSVTATDANGSCEAQTTVTVLPLPTISAGMDQDICIGDEITLTAINPDGASISWSDNVEDGVGFEPNETITYVLSAELNGCQSSDDVTITVNDLPVISANNPSACEGSTVTLNGTGGVIYTWNNGVENGVPFVPVSGTTYTVTGEDANGCVNTFDVTVTTSTYPTASFSATPTSGQPPLEVTITNNSQGDITDYSWDFGNGNTSDQDFDQITEVYNEAGNPIIVLIVSNNGCNDTLTTMLDIQFAPFSYDIPNVFTPNNDGANDYFDLKLENAAELEFYIFNRWGNLMAEIRDVNTIGWDGRTPGGAEAPDGVYFHRYRIVGLDGQVAEGHGFLHLVRD